MSKNLNYYISDKAFDVLAFVLYKAERWVIKGVGWFVGSRSEYKVTRFYLPH